VSGDGVDDFILNFGYPRYLCLGGNPLDFVPDYYMWSFTDFYPFIYTLAGGQKKLMVDRIWPQHHRLEMFNLGVPFDTLPCNLFDYGYHHGWGRVDIGDINEDGIDELALTDSTNTLVNIYSIRSVGVDDRPVLPKESNILSAYPNPFNSATVITFNGKAAKGGEVRIEIVDVLGHLVKSFQMKCTKEGSCQIKWDATGKSGEKVSSGVYFVHLVTPHDEIALKLLYLK
jgi:hypothetical protein